MPSQSDRQIVRHLARIAAVLEKKHGDSAVERGNAPRFDTHCAFAWDGMEECLKAVDSFAPLPLSCLIGIAGQKQRLYDNTERFAKGKPANSALLWGARGCGKSALVKAVVADLRPHHPDLVIVEIARDDLWSLPALAALIRRHADKRFIVFCDDLSFQADDGLGKALKTLLDGGLDSKPDNAVLYATSNRRHLIPREMTENEARAAIHSREAQDEHIALSDRFGLWIGFHPVTQDQYLAMVESYAVYFALADKKSGQTLVREALEWAAERGGFSGRVAWQFIQSVR